MRIVSLLPSATEIICALGLRNQLVGVTHECDYPDSVAGLPVVTHSRIPAGLSSGEIDGLVREQLTGNDALYTLDMPVLETLRPDLIVTQALCDVCAVAADEVNAAACALPGQPEVINLEPMRLSEVLDTLERVADAAGCAARGRVVRAGLQARIDEVAGRSQALDEPPRVAMLEWIDPLFNAGHWTPELVSIAGGRECLGNAFAPSETVSFEQLLASEPEVIAIALCGFDMTRSLRDVPLLTEHPGWRALPAVQADRVFLLDGNAYFSRPGPRLVDSTEILAHALHPGLHPPHAERARRLSQT